MFDHLQAVARESSGATRMGGTLRLLSDETHYTTVEDGLRHELDFLSVATSYPPSPGTHPILTTSRQ